MALHPCRCFVLPPSSSNAWLHLIEDSDEGEKLENGCWDKKKVMPAFGQTAFGQNRIWPKNSNLANLFS